MYFLIWVSVIYRQWTVFKDCLFWRRIRCIKNPGFLRIIFRLCNIGYPPENHLELESREIWCVRNTRLSCPLVLKFCTEKGIITVKLQNDWVTLTYVMDQRHFIKFGFKMSFWQIFYIAQPPQSHFLNFYSVVFKKVSKWPLTSRGGISVNTYFCDICAFCEVRFLI